jgi:hypothetical protein
LLSQFTVSPKMRSGGRVVMRNPVDPFVAHSQLSATSLVSSATASVASEKYGPRSRNVRRPKGTAKAAAATPPRGIPHQGAMPPRRKRMMVT